MEDDEELFASRVTQLALPETLAPGSTIRGAEPLDTLDAPASDGSLPRISIDVASEIAPREASMGPDLAIVRTIGEGGMGRVHLARQRSLHREVAVKTLKEDASPAAIAGLFREARLTGSLEHPGVIPVHALGVDARGGPLLVMKRVEGVDWATLLASSTHPLWGVLTASVDRLAANLEILTQVCRTIEFAHSRGVIHRDIKPENVMVGSYGEVYLVDWGIATPMNGQPTIDRIAGTPAYMAPEMFRGAVLDKRTDVYLLGATLHEVLTGRSRHSGKDLKEVFHSAMTSEPVGYDASVPELLGALCNAATARDPAKRPQDARSFRDQLTEFLQRRSAMALSDAAAERLARLEALLADAKGQAAPADLAAAYRLATEARFGFVQSLREHPSYAAASAGVRASILALVDLELRQQHADTAEALLREIADPDPALSARVAEVRARDDTKRRDEQRLHKLDHDRDPTVQAAPRALLVGGLVVLTTVITGLAIVTGEALTPLRVLLFGVVFTSVVALGMVLFRKRLLSNAFNRKLSALMLGTSMLIVIERLVGVIDDIPVARTFTTDLWLAASTLGAVALTLRKRIWIAIPPAVLGAALIPRYPDHATTIFSLSNVAAFVLLAVALRPDRATRPPPK